MLEGNSKITRGNGTYANPVPNAFSLPAAAVEGADSGACPGSTVVCRNSCYVKGLAKHAPEVYQGYQRNLTALQACLAEDRLFYYSALTLAMWIEENAAAGFRWHVSGDVLSVRHAEWIEEVCRLAPDVPFWIYTRTFEAVETLSRAENLAVNVSADTENFRDARIIAAAYGARLCYLTENAQHLFVGGIGRDDLAWCSRCGCYADKPSDACIPPLPQGSVIFPDYALRGRGLDEPTKTPFWRSLSNEQRKMVCSVDYFGQSEQNRCGPCVKCLT